MKYLKYFYLNILEFFENTGLLENIVFTWYFNEIPKKRRISFLSLTYYPKNIIFSFFFQIIFLSFKPLLFFFFNYLLSYFKSSPKLLKFLNLPQNPKLKSPSAVEKPSPATTVATTAYGSRFHRGSSHRAKEWHRRWLTAIWPEFLPLW